MQFFIDTADIGAIKALVPTGMVDGVTTNPSLIAKAGGDFIATVRAICDVVEGPVSAEVAATDLEGMLAEGRFLAGIAPNVVVKLPLTWAGLKATRALAEAGTAVNVTLCFSANQALLAAKAGAAYISPFIGRLDDVSEDGMELIRDIRAVYDNYPAFGTQILAASVRHPAHVRACALAGADVATLPPAVLEQLAQHPLTEKGLAQFVADWAKTGQTIPRA